MTDHDSGEDDFVANELQISCADAVELVTDYLDGALSAPDLAAFETHVSLCHGCTVFIDQIRMTIKLSRAANRAEVELMPANFDELAAQFEQRVGRAD